MRSQLQPFEWANFQSLIQEAKAPTINDLVVPMEENFDSIFLYLYHVENHTSKEMREKNQESNANCNLVQLLEHVTIRESLSDLIWQRVYDWKQLEILDQSLKLD